MDEAEYYKAFLAKYLWEWLDERHYNCEVWNKEIHYGKFNETMALLVEMGEVIRLEKGDLVKWEKIE